MTSDIHRREGLLKIIVFAITYLSLATIAYADNQIYAVQVLMAREYENAVYEYEKLKDHHDVRIEKINDAYFVRIGAYQTKTKALSLLKQLKMTHKDAFLIKYTVDKQQIMQGNQLTDQQKAKKVLLFRQQISWQIIPISQRILRLGIPISTVEKIPESTKPLEDTKPSILIFTKQSSEISKNLPELQNQSAGIEEDLLKAGHAELS